MVEYYLSSDTTYGNVDDKKIGDTGFSGVSIVAGATVSITLSSTGLGYMSDDWVPGLIPNGDYHTYAKVICSTATDTDPSNDCGMTTTTFSYVEAVIPAGTGTALDPYRISHLGHLVWLGDVTPTWSWVVTDGKHCVLQNDIDASETVNWNNGAGFSPITGHLGRQGTFDGRGKVIRNLFINRPRVENVGLFGTLGGDAELKNLGLTGAMVTGSDFVGTLIGDLVGGTVSGCYATGSVTGIGSVVGGLIGSACFSSVRGCYSTVAVSGQGQVGGLIGYHVAGTVSNCHAIGSVIATFDAGGLVGWNQDTVTECFATGPVNVTGPWAKAGGLVSFNSGNISKSYATGPVSSFGQDSHIGGLLGEQNGGGEEHSTVYRCYATGPVTALAGSATAGGLVGFMGNNSDAYTEITECYASGSVTTKPNSFSKAGGLVGGMQWVGLPVSRSFWDTQSSRQQTSEAGATGRTTAQMKKKATFTGWDFTQTWCITENVTYPLLQAAWDSGCQDLGNGWHRLSWFGDYANIGNNWIWHNKHGFLFAPASDTPQNVFFYSMDMGWLWTTSSAYPYLYRFSDAAWLWYQPDSSGPRWFLNLNTAMWESR